MKNKKVAMLAISGEKANNHSLLGLIIKALDALWNYHDPHLKTIITDSALRDLQLAEDGEESQYKKQQDRWIETLGFEENSTGFINPP